MKRAALLLVLAFCCAPLGAAQRFYFTASTAAGVTPDATSMGWEDVTESLDRHMNHAKGSSAITTGDVIDIVEDSSQRDRDRRYVSAAMAAGVNFTTSDTIKMQLMTREYAGTDDVDKCLIGIRVVNSSGTQQVSLTNIANKATAAEFINNATHRNKTCADGDALVNNYTTSAGDRLVVEIGYQTDGADTSPQASAKYGENATDCAENETDTTDCAGWIEFSTTITFEGAVATHGAMVIGAP